MFGVMGLTVTICSRSLVGFIHSFGNCCRPILPGNCWLPVVNVRKYNRLEPRKGGVDSRVCVHASDAFSACMALAYAVLLGTNSETILGPSFAGFIDRLQQFHCSPNTPLFGFVDRG